MLRDRLRRWRRGIRQRSDRNAGDVLDRLTRLDRVRSVTAFVVVPVVVAAITFLTNALDALSFLLFPPLAAATHRLFAHPGEPSSSPQSVVVGLTAGAVGGWLGTAVSHRVFGPPAGGLFSVSVPAAVLSVLCTGVLLWLIDVDLSPAYAVSLLVPLLDVPPGVFVLSVVAASGMVAAVFLGWQRFVYDRRAERLYAAVSSENNVLVPVRDDDRLVHFAGRLAAGRESSKLQLAVTDDRQAGGDACQPRRDELAADVEAAVDVTCDVVEEPGSGDRARRISRLARETNCGLVVVPYEADGDALAPWIRQLFDSDLDVVVADVETETTWTRQLVAVRRAGRLSHAMVEYARRLAGDDGRISIGTSIDDERERRAAETMCANLAEAFPGPFETRVANAPFEAFVERTADRHDMLWLGAGTDRSRPSRFVSPPVFRRVRDLDCDVAIVHRG